MVEAMDATASWPRHLQESWHDCLERGEVDDHNPPTSIVDADLQVADAQGRRVASIPWGDGTQDLADDEESLLADLTPTRATCAACGAGNLEHFYTSIRRGKVLGAACYERRVKCELSAPHVLSNHLPIPKEGLTLPGAKRSVRLHHRRVMG